MALAANIYDLWVLVVDFAVDFCGGFFVVVVVGCHAAAEREREWLWRGQGALWLTCGSKQPTAGGSQVETATSQPVITLQSGRKLPNSPKSWQVSQILAILCAALVCDVGLPFETAFLSYRASFPVTLTRSKYQTFLFCCDH